MKWLLFFLLSVLSVGEALANERDLATARSIAANWFSKHNGLCSKKLAHSNALVENEFDKAWCFTRNNNFVFIAKDTNLPTVLGYGNNADADLPVALKVMLNNKQKVKRYPLPSFHWQPVEPLLSSHRQQYAPYNNMCPRYLFNDGTLSKEPCVVGCVATAMEQILSYYKRVYTIKDTLHGWQNEHYTIPDILPGESVDSRLILDDYDVQTSTAQEDEAVAKLSYYLGVATQMDYGTETSGTYSYKLEDALRRGFGLKYIHYLDSYKYNAVAYWNYLASEIMARRPVYYSGSFMSMGGHAFVLDGLDDDGMFHCNWGMRASYDGFYRVDVLAPMQPESERLNNPVDYGMICNYEAVTVCPDEVDALPPDTLRRTGREIAIENAWFTDSLLISGYNNLKIAVHNTCSETLTTPLAILLNHVTDTALVDQAKWSAFTGCTLLPNERDTLNVHLPFSFPGAQILSITPDGEEIIASFPINVNSGGEWRLESDDPVISFPKKGTVNIEQRLYNPRTSRAANSFVFDLTDTITGINRYKTYYCYIPAKSDTIMNVKFDNIVPGNAYELKLRLSWGVERTVNFTAPTEQGIISPKDEYVMQPISYYTLDGRKLSSLSSHHKGVIIKRVGHSSVKIVR